MNTVTTAPTLMSERDVAAHCLLSPRYFKALRKADSQRIARGEPIQGPAWVVIGSIVRYRREAIEEWLTARTSGAVARVDRRNGKAQA